MRKFVYGTGFFVLLLAVGLGFYTSYRFGATKGVETARKDYVSEENTQESETRETAAAADSGEPLESHAVAAEAKSTVGYILREENDRVVVYCADGTTLYEYTDIFVSELPYDLQSQIRGGKEISGTAQLYSFLENYSS